MFRPISVKLETVDEYLQQNDYSALELYLKKEFRLEKDETGVPLKIEFSTQAVDLLHKILKTLSEQSLSKNHEGIIKELFRSLRNYVINSDVQNYLVNDENFLPNVSNFMNLQSEVIQNAFQIILQFLFNLIISNKSAVDRVYDVFYPTILSLLKDKKNIYETSALLYNMSLYKELNMDFDTYSFLLELYDSHNSVEYLYFMLEKLISDCNFWNYYLKFESNKRAAVLGVIRDKQIKGEALNIPVTGLKVLTNQFVASGNIIFQTVQNKDSSLEAYEISQLVQVISSFCSNEDYLKVLQSDKDLLINSGVLLINIHRLGKESENCFTSIQNLSEIREPNKNIQEHPAFGFKADLIRIIGNLCWKNKIMQDLTREAELIPVILDCCNMDARNPFIMQWVILAVRNLCENNMENQKIIAELHQQGTVSSSVLQELGVTLESDGDRAIKIVSLDSLRKQK
ncbi:Ataxin-10-like Protein [Tribolium castaneum]|uniref:Ataxin-10 n=1 Tax=Tribolium castaneum TaxID=7070 RepID=A0A139WF25_TRICA|nr:PREDICTED: ataxin-10 [Tribolium castaneum]KYB26544.1 Ataxin-10-like Protein [Tribolium castaneum]|eukprot:XP_008196350.1 PREDICTED: ataxin-10 [Tribolium castaneum]